MICVWQHDHIWYDPSNWVGLSTLDVSYSKGSIICDCTPSLATSLSKKWCYGFTIKKFFKYHLDYVFYLYFNHHCLSQLLPPRRIKLVMARKHDFQWPSWCYFRGMDDLCKLDKEYLNARTCKLRIIFHSRQNSKNVDVSHAFLSLVVSKLSFLFVSAEYSLVPQRYHSEEVPAQHRLVVTDW